MEYMPHIHILIFGIVAFMPEWRRTCLIIVLAALVNVADQPLVNLAAAAGDQNVHVAYVAADFITIIALLWWGTKGRFSAKTIFTKPGGAKFLLAGILTLFIATNLAILIDYKAPPYPVYEYYKEVIFTLNLIQILLIGGGIYAVVRRLGDALDNFLGVSRHGYNGRSSLGSGNSKYRDKIL